MSDPIKFEDFGKVVEDAEKAEAEQTQSAKDVRVRTELVAGTPEQVVEQIAAMGLPDDMIEKLTERVQTFVKEYAENVKHEEKHVHEIIEYWCSDERIEREGKVLHAALPEGVGVDSMLVFAMNLLLTSLDQKHRAIDEGVKTEPADKLPEGATYDDVTEALMEHMVQALKLFLSRGFRHVMGSKKLWFACEDCDYTTGDTDEAYAHDQDTMHTTKRVQHPDDAAA
jgi:hypothetical protein